MTIRTPLALAATLLLLALTTPATSHAQVARGVRDPCLRCRNAVGTALKASTLQGLRLAAACHRREGRLGPTAQCNAFSECTVAGGVLTCGGDRQPCFDPGGAFARKFNRAVAKLENLCPTLPVLANYPGFPLLGDRSPCLLPRLEALLTTVVGGTDLAASADDRACRAAVASGVKGIVGQVLAQSLACQRRTDRAAVKAGSDADGPLTPACFATGNKARTRAAKQIARKCAAAGAIGTCTPLPECAIAASVRTGHLLASDAYRPIADGPHGVTCRCLDSTTVQLCRDVPLDGQACLAADVATVCQAECAAHGGLGFAGVPTCVPDAEACR